MFKAHQLIFTRINTIMLMLRMFKAHQLIFARINKIMLMLHMFKARERLVNERAKLKSSVVKVGKWPVNKSELTNRHLKQLLTYINSIDLEKLNQMQINTLSRNGRLR